MTRILIFGASIVWGADDSEFGGWVSRFKIYYKTTAKFNEVFNLGNPGEETTRLLKRIENECKARIKSQNKERDMIIISIGTNDSQFQKNMPRTPIEKFEKNIQELISICKKVVTKIVFVGLTPVDGSRTKPILWNKDKSYTNKRIEEYDNIIKLMCEKENIHYIPVFNLLTNDDLEDGLHPNSKGHEKIFQKVKDFLVEKKLV